jgi:hypothetical protein
MADCGDPELICDINGDGVVNDEDVSIMNSLLIGTTSGTEVCGDGVDNDCNGFVDESDELCPDPAAISAPETRCANGIDDDRNSLIDCDDLGCANDPVCDDA